MDSCPLKSSYKSGNRAERMNCQMARNLAAGMRVEQTVECQINRGCDRPLLAGSSQGGAQVRRRKPVVRGEPAREILAGSPTAGDGRMCEVGLSVPELSLAIRRRSPWATVQADEVPSIQIWGQTELLNGGTDLGA